MGIGAVTNMADVAKGFEAMKKLYATTVVQTTKKTANTIVETVVQGTPVLTGEHKGGWQAGIGSEPAGTTALDPDGGTTIANAESVIATAQLGQTIIIMNDKPVIEDLNNGRSDKAPAGFVERAIDRATAKR